MTTSNLKQINDQFVRHADKFRRMFLGCSSKITSIENKTVKIETTINKSFLESYQRTIESFCFEVATSAVHFIQEEITHYEVAIFYQNVFIGFAAKLPERGNNAEDFAQSFYESIKEQVEASSDPDSKKEFLDHIKGDLKTPPLPHKYGNPVEYSNIDLIRWLERIGFDMDAL